MESSEWITGMNTAGIIIDEHHRLRTEAACSFCPRFVASRAHPDWVLLWARTSFVQRIQQKLVYRKCELGRSFSDAYCSSCICNGFETASVSFGRARVLAFYRCLSIDKP